MFSFARGHQRWFLWLLALAVLCFVASLYPELRRHLWGQPDPVSGARRG